MDFADLTGIAGYCEKIAEPADSASRYGSGLVDVFSTPALVAFVEKTCMLSVNENLPEGYSTVGVRIELTHEKATPIGKMVYCNSTVSNIDGKKIRFEVVACDEKGIIGRGYHDRYIIEVSSFMAKL
ncbi:MAG: dihydrolipoamide acyltransferase [Bacteroidales bacterium]|nr:dihydrolipoamide acyltransferase [Bacteroidales bacterium]HQP03110.1 dihydrolipoamide acyltransferase [Bacteroidales bacterium]